MKTLIELYSFDEFIKILADDNLIDVDDVCDYFNNNHNYGRYESIKFNHIRVHHTKKYWAAMALIQYRDSLQEHVKQRGKNAISSCSVMHLSATYNDVTKEWIVIDHTILPNNSTTINIPRHVAIAFNSYYHSDYSLPKLLALELHKHYT